MCPLDRKRTLSFYFFKVVTRTTRILATRDYNYIRLYHFNMIRAESWDEEEEVFTWGRSISAEELSDSEILSNKELGQ